MASRLTGIVLGLDLATQTGVAIGRPGEIPKTFSVRLKKPDEHRSIAFSNLIAFLSDTFTQHAVVFVAKERMLSLEAFKQIKNAESTVRMTAGIHAVTEAMCIRFNIPWTEAADSTIRKHFIGRGRMGTREETKKAVVQRCKLLKILPDDCNDDNQADAAATHDWACATYGKSSVTNKDFQFFS